jgi:predicted site-specific integrase-resolvase
LLTVADAAAIIDVTEDTIRKWCRAGKITFVQLKLSVKTYASRKSLSGLEKAI